MELFDTKVNATKNRDIFNIPDYDEVKAVVWAMNPIKSLGPDGMPSLFIKPTGT